MNPVTHVRQHVFKCSTQGDFARLLGTSQATVSRWEAKGRFPGNAQDVVRAKGRALGEWDDAWFFTVPSGAADTECASTV